MTVQRLLGGTGASRTDRDRSANITRWAAYEAYARVQQAWDGCRCLAEAQECSQRLERGWVGCVCLNQTGLKCCSVAQRQSIGSGNSNRAVARSDGGGISGGQRSAQRGGVGGERLSQRLAVGGGKAAAKGQGGRHAVGNRDAV